ncbi:hypothetical protein [Asanoa iriomotensis]|uniref:Uncharacterized protein n=1 Tax=Asanoa iriomotensis TaxID=234613 RepID=A0ABQ4C351_9ACTN|nr:hypothetical protein [Asanoa iriomotensis]GIF57202.1 hypothetical protein Air01nite_32970 [Asanoa iriomotensis]
MSYVIEAALGRAEVLRAAVRDQPIAVVVLLPHELAMVPMTDALLDALAGEPVLGFEKLPAGFADVLASCSATGPVGYVEADFFGGTGTQRAALWAGGALAAGPLSLDEDEPFGPDGSPISQILRRLGVPPQRGRDEFDAVGLGRHRWTADWAG